MKAGSIQEVLAVGDPLGLGDLKVDAFLFDTPWGIIPNKVHDEVIPRADIPEIVSGMLRRLKEFGLIGVRVPMGPVLAFHWWEVFVERGLHCFVIRITDTMQQANSRTFATRKRPLPAQVGHQWVMAFKEYRPQYHAISKFCTFVLAVLDCLSVFMLFNFVFFCSP